MNRGTLMFVAVCLVVTATTLTSCSAVEGALDRTTTPLELGEYFDGPVVEAGSDIITATRWVTPDLAIRDQMAMPDHTEPVLIESGRRNLVRFLLPGGGCPPLVRIDVVEPPPGLDLGMRTPKRRIRWCSSAPTNFDCGSFNSRSIPTPRSTSVEFVVVSSTFR